MTTTCDYFHGSCKIKKLKIYKDLRFSKKKKKKKKANRKKEIKDDFDVRTHTLRH